MLLTKILEKIGIKERVNQIRPQEYILLPDLSTGQEIVPIPVLSQNPDDIPPKDFKYIVRNVEGSHGAHLDGSMTNMHSCKCDEQGCLSGCECQQNIYQKGNRLSDKLNLKAPPMIYECNPRCACAYDKCENRVIQKGMSDLPAPVQLFKTEHCGWGIRSVEAIPKGSFLCEYVGEVIDTEDSITRTDDMYFFNLSSEYSTKGLLVDSKFYGNWSRYVNHSCAPNCVALKAFTDSQDSRRPKIVFFAREEIPPFTELTIDYGERYWVVKHQRENIFCMCGHKKCRFSSKRIEKTARKFMDIWMEQHKIQRQQEQEQAAQTSIDEPVKPEVPCEESPNHIPEGNGEEEACSPSKKATPSNDYKCMA